MTEVIPITHTYTYEPVHLYDAILVLQTTTETSAATSAATSTATSTSIDGEHNPKIDVKCPSTSHLSHEYHVHRSILASHCQYFASVTMASDRDENDKNITRINLPTPFIIHDHHHHQTITSEQLDTFFQHLYQPHRPLTPSIAIQIVSLAFYFDCSFLLTLCERILSQHIKLLQAQNQTCIADELISILVLANENHFQSLERELMDAVVRHFTGVPYQAIITVGTAAINYICPSHTRDQHHTLDYLLTNSSSFRTMSLRQVQRLAATLIAKANGFQPQPNNQPIHLYSVPGSN